MNKIKYLLSIMTVAVCTGQVTPLPSDILVKNIPAAVNSNFDSVLKFTAGTTIPSTCTPTTGVAFYKTDTKVWYQCTDTNVFSSMQGPTGATGGTGPTGPGLAFTGTAGTGGVTANLAIMKDASNPLRYVTQTSVSTGCWSEGFAGATATSGNTFTVSAGGAVTAIADNAITSGNLVGCGTATAGRVRDLGTTDRSTISNAVTVIGYATASASLGATVSIWVDQRQGQLIDTLNGGCTISSQGKLSCLGSNGYIQVAEGTGPTSCTAGSGFIWPDVASHTWKYCNNAGAAKTLGAIATTSSVGLVTAGSGLVIDSAGSIHTNHGADATTYGWDALLTENGCPTGWASRTVGTGPTVTGQDSNSATFVGSQAKINSSSTASGYMGCQFGSGNAIGKLGQATDWDTQIIFQLGQTTNTRFYAGYAIYNVPVNSTAGVWLRYDTNASMADTTFKFQTCSANPTCTLVDTTIAADTSWHRLRIQSTTIGQIIFTLYDATGTIQAGPTTISTTIPSVPVTASIVLGNDTTASVSFAFWNKFGFRIRSLVR